MYIVYMYIYIYVCVCVYICIYIYTVLPGNTCYHPCHLPGLGININLISLLTSPLTVDHYIKVVWTEESQFFPDGLQLSSPLGRG